MNIKAHLEDTYWLYIIIAILAVLLVHAYAMHYETMRQNEIMIDKLTTISNWIESNNFETQCEK